MATIVKDTHQLIKFLQSKGYSKEQAEGFVEAVKELNFDVLATKSDLRDLRFDITKNAYFMHLGQIVAQTALLIAVIQLFLR